MARKTPHAIQDRRLRFASEYAVDLNGPRAALAAGYAKAGAATRASKLLALPDVRAEVDRLLEERRKRLETDADQIVSDLRTVASTCMQKVPIYGPGGEIVAYKLASSSGANRALELLGKTLGMFVDRREVDTTSDIVLRWQEPVSRADIYGDDDFGDGDFGDQVRAPAPAQLEVVEDAGEEPEPEPEPKRPHRFGGHSAIVI